MHLIGWLSLPRLVVFFSGALKCSVIWAIFVCVCVGTSVTLRGGSLGVHQGGVTLVAASDAVRGGGAEREQWRPLPSPPDFSLSLRYPQSSWAPMVLVPE